MNSMNFIHKLYDSRLLIYCWLTQFMFLQHYSYFFFLLKILKETHIICLWAYTPSSFNVLDIVCWNILFPVFFFISCANFATNMRQIFWVYLHMTIFVLYNSGFSNNLIPIPLTIICNQFHKHPMIIFVITSTLASTLIKWPFLVVQIFAATIAVAYSLIRIICYMRKNMRT